MAQARASAVSQAISAEAGTGSGLAVEVRTWGSVAEMAAAQSFNDSVGEYDPELGFLGVAPRSTSKIRVVAAGV